MTSLPAFALPALYNDMPHEVYHRDPVPGGSLSASGAKTLLRECPAKFDWERKHPDMRKQSKEFDIGQAAHSELLGVGPGIEVFDYDDWRKGPARADKAAAYAAGKIPLLPDQYDMVTDMVQAVRDHHIAGALFEEGTGQPEQSMFWRNRGGPDAPDMVNRARLDWLSTRRDSQGRLIIPDYKTANSARPDKCERAVSDHGYHMSGAWYIDAVIECGLTDDAVFLWVFQEKEPPYIITVMEMHPVEMLWPARELNDKAREVFAKCQAANHWPPYVEDIVSATLPPWEMKRMDQLVNQNAWISGSGVSRGV